MEVTHREENKKYDESTAYLVNGTNNLFILPVVAIENQILELMKKQLILIEQLHNENLKLAWSQNSTELHEIYSTLKIYDTKLTNLKRNMKLLHGKAIKLKKKVSRLQQFQKTQVYIQSQQRV